MHDVLCRTLVSSVGFGALVTVFAVSGCGGGSGGDTSGGTGAGATTGAGGAAQGTGGSTAAGGDSQGLGGAGVGGGPPSACTVSTAEANIAPGATSFAMFFDAGRYIVAFADPSSGAGDIKILTLDASGAPSGAATLLESTPDASMIPSIAKTGAGYVVAWQDVSAAMVPTVHLHALDASGNPTGSGATMPPSQSTEARPVVSASPGGTALAWMDATGGVPSAFVTLLDETTLAPKGSPTQLGTAAGASHPWLTGDATSLAVIWSDKRGGQFDEYFGKLDASLALSGDVSLRMGATKDALLGRMIKTSTGYLASWEDARTGSNQIFGALTDGGGMLSWSGVVEQGGGDANWPHMAWDGKQAAVVYYQFRNGAVSQVYLTLLDESGARVAGGGDLQISSTPKTGKAKYPDVVFNGSGFGVGWIDSRAGATSDLYFASVTCQ